MLVHVWPDKYPKSWDGVADLDNFVCHPAMPYTEALAGEYRYDAHFCPAILVGAEVFPRLNTKLAPEYLAEVRFYTIVLDVDGPNHECTDEWYSEQIACLRGTPWEGCIYYRTKGGFRLMWELPEALKIHEYKNLYKALSTAIKKIGIESDPICKDWTRCYRLPFVKRDGKNERRELVVPENPILPMQFLEFSRTEEKEKTLGSTVAAHKMMLDESSAGDIQDGSRNDKLFRLMSSLRNVAWISEELAVTLARAINSDLVSPPLEDSEVEHIAKNVWGRYSAGTKGLEIINDEGEVEVPQVVSNKAKIVCGLGDLDGIVRECIEALRNHPDVYVRQGKLVRVIGEQMSDIPRHALRTRLAEVADFWKIKESENGLSESPIDIPKDVVDCVYEHADYPGMRELEQIRTLPALRPDGAVLNGEGYDEVTRTLFKPEFTVELPEEITYEDAVAAKDRIKELYKDFLFGDERVHLAASMALMMTPILRLTIKGPTPLFLCESPIRGAGKTLTASMATIVATGKPPAVMAPTNEEETEKRIVTKLLSGAKIIFIDNVERPVGGPALDAALTSEWYEARLMRSHELLTLYNGATWMITGNNIVLAGDIARRIIRILIDPKMEHPEDRKGLPDIKKICMEKRVEIVRDVLIMALARHGSGFTVNKPMGSFEQWSYWVRETLMYLGEADCLDSQNAIKQAADVGTFGTLMTCAFNVFQPKGARSFVASTKFTGKDMWDVIFEGNQVSGKREHLQGLVAAYQEMTNDPSLKEVGRLLTRWSNRIINGYKVIVHPRDQILGVQFQIVKADMEGSLEESTGDRREPEHRPSTTESTEGDQAHGE